jgi:hypothetical protein
MSKHTGAVVMSATLATIVAAVVATSSAFAGAAEKVSTAPTGSASRDARVDTTFHPDYSKALSVEQMSAAWQAELDRLFPQPVTGGG